MASENIFERYGIKEVANVYFEALEGDLDGITAGDIVLYLDTLKVSTIETTAENVSAQGGWGNPKLVTWDYGKEINITLEDAVISWEEMRILLGAQLNKGSQATPITIRKNAEVTFSSVAEWKPENLCYKGAEADKYAGLTNRGKHNLPTTAPTDFKWVDLTRGERGNQSDFMTKAPTAADFRDEGNNPRKIRVRIFWEDTTTTESQEAAELVISPDRYPGTYRVVGDALIRSEKTGNDEAFQFVINKAKLLSEVTLTMQAEGDPSTFNMTLNVLRDAEGGNMMSLIKY